MSLNVNISSITGVSPYDIFICDTGATSCYYVDTISGVPYSFQIYPPFDEFDSYLLKIVDSNDCVISGITSVMLPTPTPTVTTTQTITPSVTPTMTPTPTICLDCYQYLFGPAISSGTVMWTNCDGTLGSQFVSIGNILVIDCALSTPTGNGPVSQISSCGTNCPTPTPTPTSTSTPITSYYEYVNSGFGNTVIDACNDAIINYRNLYSNCQTNNFGIGCYVYSDNNGTILTGSNYVFMLDLVWDIDSLTGQITNISSTQC